MKRITKNKSIVKLPAIDVSRCTKCNRCIAICPNKAISVVYDPSYGYCSKCIKYCISMSVPCNPENLVFSYELCDSCGLCISACLQNAIYWFLTDPAHIKNSVSEKKKKTNHKGLL